MPRNTWKKLNKLEGEQTHSGAEWLCGKNVLATRYLKTCVMSSFVKQVERPLDPCI